MKEYNRCIDVCAEATSKDKDGKNLREIEAQSQKALQAQFAAREGETDEQAQARIQRVCTTFHRSRRRGETETRGDGGVGGVGGCVLTTMCVF